MGRGRSRAIRRALVVTAAVSGSIVLLAAAFTGSRTALAVGAVEVAFACILSAVERLLGREDDGRQVPLDDDRQRKP